MALATAIAPRSGMNGGKDAGVTGCAPFYITSERARNSDHAYHITADCISPDGDRANFDLLLINFGEVAIENAIAKAGYGDRWTVLSWQTADTDF